MNLSLIKDKKLLKIRLKYDTLFTLIRHIYRLDNRYFKRYKARRTRNDLLVTRLRILDYLKLLRCLLRLLLIF